MKRSLRRTRVVGAALVTAVLVAACSSGQGSGSSLPVEKVNLTVAAVPALDSAALYIAEQRGYFAAQGLHVKIVPAVSGATVLSAQLAGKYDVTLGNYVSYIQADALEQHADFRILAAASIMAPRTQELLVPSGSKIDSVTQLAGKKVGVNAPNNIGTLLINSALNDNGGQPLPGSDYQAIDFPHMAQALAKHQIAAAWLPEPFITLAEMKYGAQVLTDLDQGSTGNLPIAGYMVTQRWLKKYPGTAAAFYRALEEGQRVADQNLQAVRDGMVKYAGIPRNVAEIVTAPQYPLVTNARVIQRVANLMLFFSMIPQAFDVSNIIAKVP